jgi:SAM-dependent methyltransferase
MTARYGGRPLCLRSSLASRTVSANSIAPAAEAQKFLVKGRPDYRGDLAAFYEGLWRTALKSAESIRAGAPTARLDFSNHDDEALEAFFRRQYPSSLGAGQELAAHLDMSGYAHLADIGGGTGGASIGICRLHTALRSTVYDLPSVVPFAKAFIREAGLSHVIDVVDADLTRPLEAPQLSERHDVALLRSVLQVLSANSARAVLRNARMLLKPEGVLLIVGSVLQDSRAAPASALARGLVFLNAYDDGHSYTQSEYFSWLSDAGFVELAVEYDCLRDGSSVITARRA